MTSFALPVLFTLFVWWFSTGAILYLDGLPRRTFPWTMQGATLVLIAALYGLAVTRHDTGIAGTYLAFTCAVAVWGWQEIGFLLGYVTGPRRVPCPPDALGWRRVFYALQTIQHHEMATAVLAVAVVVCVGSGANRVGIWTYIVLWTMRQSAKLNLFLGVRNLGEQLLPDHLRYFASYFAHKPMNPLFPVSLLASAVMMLRMWQQAADAEPGSGAAAGSALVGTLLALAILEHLFMVLPLPTDALWRWGLRSRRTKDHAASSGGQALQSWTAELSGRCDPHGVRALLESVARGAFGDVHRVDGIARAEVGWIEFRLVAGRSDVAACLPRRRATSRVVAVGRDVDEVRLRAAFAACALPTN
jgi:putative photosynthetic complex assembly protein 2